MSGWWVRDGLLVHQENSTCRERGCHQVAVIDPEDAEQIERLADLVVNLRTGNKLGNAYPAEYEHLAAALREFASPSPPKPAEPTGLGAVVVDMDGAKWVRSRLHSNGLLGALWENSRTLSHCRWENIDAVRTLSEGLPS